MNRLAAAFLLLLSAQVLSALDNTATLDYTGSTWLSWTKAQRLTFLAGVTYGELNTVIRIAQDLNQRGVPYEQLESSLFPYGCYEGDLNTLENTITQALRADSTLRQEALLTLLLAHRWQIYPVDQLEPAD